MADAIYHLAVVVRVRCKVNNMTSTNRCASRVDVRGGGKRKTILDC